MLYLSFSSEVSVIVDVDVDVTGTTIARPVPNYAKPKKKMKYLS
jgi:ribosomal protein L14